MLQALLAERVGFDVFVSYPSPRSTVPFRGIIGSLVLVVPGVHHLGVFLTVTVVGEFGTAGVTARLLGFGRHGGYLLSGKQKARMVSHTGFVLFFRIIIIS